MWNPSTVSDSDFEKSLSEYPLQELKRLEFHESLVGHEAKQLLVRRAIQAMETQANANRYRTLWRRLHAMLIDLTVVATPVFYVLQLFVPPSKYRDLIQMIITSVGLCTYHAVLH